jgi:nicotinamidase-related amidase
MKPTPGVLAPPPRHDRWRTAVLVLDVQRDFFEGDGRMPVSAAHAREVLAATNAIVDAAAARGVLVAYVANEFPPSQRLGNFFRRHAAVAGTRGAELDPRLHVVSEHRFAKWASDAFSNATLEAWMRRNEVGHLIVAGVFANACVRQTVRGAINRGYAVHVVEDGVGARSDRARASALAGLAKRGAQLATGAAIVASIQGMSERPRA